MKTKVVVMLSLVCLVGLNGCTTVAKRTFKEAMGAEGKVLEVRGVSTATLRTYKAVKVGNVTNEIAPLCSQGQYLALRAALPEAFAELKEQFPGGQPEVSVDVAIQYVQRGGTLSSIVGPDQYLIGRVYLRGNEPEPVSELIVVAHSEAMRTGDKELAEAAAEGIAEYLEKKHKGKEQD